MKHFTEILKIIEGGLQQDLNKVLSYSELLSKNLELAGDMKAADRIKNKLNSKPTTFFNAASINPIPLDSESRLELADEKRIKDGEVEIFLNERNRNLIKDFLQYIYSSDILTKEGVGIAPSLLIYGPPGCGKTLLAYFIASKLDLPLVIARSDTLISSYLGSTAKNIRQLFEHVNSRPCILFLDEFDALAKVRDDQNELGELKRVVVSLLQNIDALDPNTIFIGATNHEHLLDPAIWRRFNFKLHLEHPSEEVRSDIIKKYLNRHIDSKMTHLLAVASEELSGSDIKDISENSLRKMLIDGETSINFRNTISKIINAKNTKVDTSNPEACIKHLRDINAKAFTYDVLAELYDMSKGKISSIFNSK